MRNTETILLKLMENGDRHMIYAFIKSLTIIFFLAQCHMLIKEKITKKTSDKLLLTQLIEQLLNVFTNCAYAFSEWQNNLQKKKAQIKLEFNHFSL